jgi:cation-transporting ATPase F
MAAVKECRAAGIEVKMITGDHVATAQAIARDMGIGGADPSALTGSQLGGLEGEDFDRVACGTSVFARVAPEQKYRLVESLQGSGAIVAMTGDGVNDAPALKRADIGVAMGKAGSDVAKDASDMVLTDDNFASIVAAVEEGRTVLGNLVKSLAYILPTNLGEGLVVMVALLGGYMLPITPVQILWINTVTTVTLALPLAWEPREAGIMDVPPRDPNTPIVSSGLIVRVITVGVYMVAAAFAIFLYERNVGAGIQEARTAAVSTIVAIEMFYLFQARSERIPVWRLGLFSNPYIWIGVPVVALLQLAFVYIPTMNFFFGSSSLGGDVWLRVLLVSFPVMIVVGIERAIMRKLRGGDEFAEAEPRACRRF